MTLQQLRHIAIGAVRSQLNAMGIDPAEYTGDNAYDVLDGMCQDSQHKDKLFKQWWERSTPNQYELFKRDWRKTKRERRRYESG